jgi:methyl-accepting chemotaxis protein
MLFKGRIDQFIDFRKELARRAVEISPAAGREWGDNDAARGLLLNQKQQLETIVEPWKTPSRASARLPCGNFGSAVRSANPTCLSA